MNLLSERLRWSIAEEAKRRGAETIRPAELARAAKTSQTAVGYWLDDVNGIGAAKARLLADYLHVDAYWLETGRGSPDLATPVAQEQSARTGSLSLQAETPKEMQMLMVHRSANELERQEIDDIIEEMRLRIEARARDKTQRAG